MDSQPVVRSPLSLKGISLVKHKKHKKKRHKRKKKHKRRDLKEEGSGTETDTDDNSEGIEQNEGLPVRKPGTGRILTSGTTVYGKDGTKFMKELANGDVVIIKHPTSLAEEIRVVTIVLSDVSMSISSPFSSDLVTAGSFEYMKKPKERNTNKKRKREKSRKEIEEEEKLAFGTYATVGNKVTYRIRKGGANASGGYMIITETLKQGDKPPSREELMNLRAKKKSDRYCM